MTSIRVPILFRVVIALAISTVFGACERHTAAETAHFSKPHGGAAHAEEHAESSADKSHEDASGEPTPVPPARKFFN